MPSCCLFSSTRMWTIPNHRIYSAHTRPSLLLNSLCLEKKARCVGNSILSTISNIHWRPWITFSMDKRLLYILTIKYSDKRLLYSQRNIQHLKEVSKPWQALEGLKCVWLSAPCHRVLCFAFTGGISHFKLCSPLSIAVRPTQYCCQLKTVVKKEVLLYYLRCSNDSLEAVVCKSRAKKTFKQDHNSPRVQDVNSWPREGLHATTVIFPIWWN